MLVITSFMEKVTNITKTEIERAINGKDDFVKLDYLNRYLSHIDNFDLKKYVLLNLAMIHESKNMVPAAIANIIAAADISITYKEKIELYMRVVELHIKRRNFPMAENALKQAMYFAPEMEKTRLKSRYVDIFWNIAKEFEANDKLRQAIEIYEYILSLNQTEEKKTEVKTKLLEYYNKRGMIREYNKIKNIR